MKKTIAVLMALAFAASAWAQLGEPSTIVTSGSTTGCYAAITNNTTCYGMTNAPIDVSSKTLLSVALVASLSDSGTTANSMVLQHSVDKVNWVTTLTVPWTPAGTTPVTTITNITLGAVKWYRVYSIANANGNTGFVTNYTVKVSLK